MFDSNYNANNTVLPIYQPNNNTNSNHPFDDHFFNSFPSHLLDDDELFLNTILPYHPQPSPPLLPPPPPQQQPPPPLYPTTAVNDDTNNGQNSDEPKRLRRKGAVKKKQEGGGSSKRKAGKKDRHSKIYTAHGPRDRRMRLSLQIARKFFDLQDMLGFDKASKTIEWLFSKSRAAIKDLAENSCTTAVTSSPLGEADCSDGGKNNKNQENLMSEKRVSTTKGGVNKMNEKRKQARARARERTQEKKILKNKEVLEMDENPNYNVVRVDKVHQLEDQMASVGIMENYLVASSSMADFRHDCHQDGAFSMEFMGNNGDYESSGVDVGLMQELVRNSEYNQVDEGPNCVFMDRTYNHHHQQQQGF